MDESKSIPIKVAEISINKFNDQIHHKVLQLKQFRVTNTKASTLGDFEKLRKEAINSLRVVKQLKQLLIEIEHLKSKTKSEDHIKFDELTSQRRNEALKEIQMYQGEVNWTAFSIQLMQNNPFLDMKPIEKLNELSPSATNDIDYASPSSVEINNDSMKVQLRVDDREVRSRELQSKQAL